jgi:hypothetical protein
MLVGMGNPLGTRNPHGYGFGQNFIPVMGMGFLAGIFFLRGYEFGQVISNGFLPLPSHTHMYRRGVEYSECICTGTGTQRHVHADAKQRRGGCRCCCCCARRRPCLGAAERRAAGRPAQATLGTRERRAAGAGHAGRNKWRRVTVRARPGWAAGAPALSVYSHAVRRPKAARWMRAARALRRGRPNGVGPAETVGVGGMCGWAGSWRAVWSDLVGCVALLCFLGQRELSSTQSALCRCPARVRRRHARARQASSLLLRWPRLDSTPLHFGFHPPEPSKNPKLLPLSVYFQITTPQHDRCGRPGRAATTGLAVVRCRNRTTVPEWTAGVSAVLDVRSYVHCTVNDTLR